MNTTTAINSQFDPFFFLSEMIGIKVLSKGKKIGKLSEMIILETDKIPEVTHFIVQRPFGYQSLLIPLNKVKKLNKKEMVIDIDRIESYEYEPKESQILLKDYILDKKVVDLDGNEVEVVYDVKLIYNHSKFYVTEVDFSKYGLLRRIGLKWLADFIYSLADKIKEETLSWTYIQPLPAHLSSFKGNVQLKVLKEKLPEIHPVDLADILEELDHHQRLAIFNELDVEQASDTLEEVEPRVQRDLISSIKIERVVELINDMTPAQASDILDILPASDADNILTLIDSDSAQKIKMILEKHEEKILNFATTHFIAFPPTMKVRQVLGKFRQAAKDKDVVMYLYIVDEQNKLLGVTDIKEILQAETTTVLEDIMIANVISLKPENTLKDAVNMFSRYGFQAIPVTDDNEIILGVIPHRDVMNLEHHLL